MMEKVGLGGLVSISAETHQAYTLEFLTTLSKTENPVGVPKIHFRLARQRLSMTYDELRVALGITVLPDGKFVILDTAEFNGFWCAITGLSRKTHNDKIHLIPHPALRLLHRFFTMTFLGHGGPNNVTQMGLSCLWAMTPEGRDIPDWADMFVSSCIRQRDATGSIPMGV
ncbi:hypothetical protein RND81_04G063800 [Saponaria officinalis]|uniref:Integrase zinc-binding domain-containing protein n=1 Tax=Saponaria officinalis TaxID=3572 RepID=A0AAW1LJB0_SAPOF